MTATRDDVIKRFADLAEMYQRKADQYTPEGNPFANLDAIGDMTDLKSEFVLLTLMAKHIVCLYDSCVRSSPSPALVDELTGDIATYCAMLAVMVRDQWAREA